MSNIILSGSISATGVSILGNANIVFSSDANHTLVVSEYTNNFLAITSNVTLTNQRDLIAPLVAGQSFIVQNNTTGGQAIRIIGSSGTGVVVPAGSSAPVFCDGVNYLAASSGSSSNITVNQITPGAGGQVLMTEAAPIGFAVLAGSGIINTGNSTIAGDVGTYPVTTETGFGSLTIDGTNHGGDSTTQAAKTALVNQYNTAAGLTPTATIPVELAGNTYGPGIYNSSGGNFHIGGMLTLDGGGNPNAQFTFQATTTLITASSSMVVLQNGAQTKNIIWAVGNTVTLGNGSTMQGIILAVNDITLETNATVQGAALTQDGYFTLDASSVILPNTIFSNWVTMSGDIIVNDVGLVTVQKIQNNPILSQVLGASQDGYVLTWSNSDDAWKGKLPGNIFNGLRDTALGTGVVHSDSGGNFSSSSIIDADVSATANIQISKLQNGAAGSFLVNGPGLTPVPSWIVISGDIGASISSVGNLTVKKLQGNPILSEVLGSSQDGYSLTWNNSGPYWEASPTAGTVAATGDLSGTYPDLTVIQINGAPVSTAPATIGNVLQIVSITPVPTLGYAPINLGGGVNFVAGQLPQFNIAPGNPGQVLMTNVSGLTPVTRWNDITGDALVDPTGVWTNTTARGLTSASTVVNVSAATAPINGQVLTATSGTAAVWQSPGVGGMSQLIGDVLAGPGSGTQVAEVVAINGASVPAVGGGLTTGNVLQVDGYSSLTYGPVNLAGGPNFVAGVVPILNLPDLLGDVTGAITSNTVVALQNNPVQSLLLGPSEDGYFLVWTAGADQWQARPLASTSAAITAQQFSFSNSASDIGGYDQLLNIATGSQGDADSGNINSSSGKTLIEAFASPVDSPFVELIPAGFWQFDFYAYVSTTGAWTTQLIFDVYTRDTSNVETLIFSVTGPNIGGTSPSLYNLIFSQPTDTYIARTTRIVIKVSAITTDPTNVKAHFVFDGTTNASLVRTPIAGAAIQLGGDLSGVTSNAVVRAISGSSPIIISPNEFQWKNTASPLLDQAATTSGVGADFTIQAQGTTDPSHQAGGNLNLSSGTSFNGRDGYVNLQTGGTTQLTVTSANIIFPNIPSTTYLSTDVSGKIVGNTATIIISGTAAGGDLAGTYPNPTVTQARGLVTSGATVVVSAASPPLTGQVLTATSATTANWQGNPSAGITALTGDVTASGAGTVTATVVAISGSSPIVINPNVLTWVANDTTPTLTQQQQTTGSTPFDFNIAPQAPGAGATGGNGSPGNLNVVLAVPLSTGTEAALRVQRNGQNIFATGIVPTTTLGGIWLFNTTGGTGGTTNYTLSTDEVTTTLNGPSDLSLALSNTVYTKINTSGIQFFNGSTSDLGSGVGVLGIHDATTAPTTAPTNGIILYSNGGVASLWSPGLQFNKDSTVVPTISQANETSNSVNGNTLTIQAQNSTGTTTVGGILNLTSGTGTTAAGAVHVQTGGTTRLTANATGVITIANLGGSGTGIVAVDNSGNLSFATGSAPSGSAGGDLSGTYPNPTVAKIQGNAVQSGTLGTAQDGYVLTWHNASSQNQWLPAPGTSGAVTGTTRTVITTYPVDSITPDYIILANPSTGFTITLPAPTQGRLLTITDISGTAETNNITIAPHASESIGGVAASYILQTNWGVVRLVSDSTNWYFI